MKEGIRLLWKNGPMRRVLIIVLMVVFGEAFRNAVSLFFIRDIIGVPTIGAAYFFYFVAGLGAIPFCSGSAERSVSILLLVVR